MRRREGRSGRAARDGSRRRLGQFFTPREAAAFVLDCAAFLLGRRPRQLLDPACGEGVFLELALERGIVGKRRAFGVELAPKLVRRASRLGLDGGVLCGDALAGELPPGLKRSRDRGVDLVVGNPPFGGGEGGGRLEIRFAELFCSLVAPGGVGGVILPVGVFANARSQRLRDSLLEKMAPAAVVELPPATFRREGAAARTCALFFRARPARTGGCLLARPAGDLDPGPYLGAVRELLVGDSRGRPACVRRRTVRAGSLRGRRWDPGYWCSDAEGLLSRARVPLAPLGRFVEHITYGPIVTGERARRHDGGGVKVVGLREIGSTRIDLARARSVAEGGPRDPERCRLRRGDLAFARSGAGSLMKGRLAVFDSPAKATVGCFVDLVRLSGISPGYVALCLRARLGRAQVERLANGVGTPNLSFGEIRGLLVPRLGGGEETRLAREEALVRALARRRPDAARRRLDDLLAETDRVVFDAPVLSEL